jgi:hypothetical protein
MNKRCKHIGKDGYRCLSYAFNLYKDDIDQGELCDVHYWQERALKAEALAQPEQEPVAWVDPATLHHLKIGLEGVHLVYETEMVNSLPLYEKPQGWRDNVAQAYLKGFDECSAPLLKAKERLIRIMNTFDLATGHADTFDELLDSLESELRDVLGHYREALKQNQSEPVAYLTKRKLGGSEGLLRADMVDRSAKNQETHYFIPLYTHPPQRTWVGLTIEEIAACCMESTTTQLSFYNAIEAKLKDKNCVG